MSDPVVRALRLKLLGAMLREARMAAGKSIKETARLTGVSPATLVTCEAGRKSLTLPELELFCLRFQLPIRRFWSGEPQTSPAPADWDPVVVLALRHRAIGASLRANRLAARLSVRQLAERVGIPASRISAYERGERGVPLVELISLSEALGQPVDSYVDQAGPLGKRDSAERAVRAIADLPPDLRDFVTDPANLPYLRLALRLSTLPHDRLREVAEGLQALVP
jgi:transcriptional regulator with XRE-family HTH domain